MESGNVCSKVITLPYYVSLARGKANKFSTVFCILNEVRTGSRTSVFIGGRGILKEHAHFSQELHSRRKIRDKQLTDIIFGEENLGGLWLRRTLIEAN